MAGRAWKTRTQRGPIDEIEEDTGSCRMESKYLGSDSKTARVEKNREELKEKKDDEALQCHDSSDSNSKSGSGSDSNGGSKSGSLKGHSKGKSKERASRKKKLKKKALNGKLTEKASKTKDEGSVVNSDEEKLECHSDSSSKSSSKSASSSKSSSSSKSVSSSKSNSDSGSKSGSDSGGKKTRVTKKGLKQKAKDGSTEENKVPEKNKLAEAELEVEAKGAEKTETTATSKEEKKGILEGMRDELPVSGKNVARETTETATEGN